MTWWRNRFDAESADFMMNQARTGQPAPRHAPDGMDGHDGDARQPITSLIHHPYRPPACFEAIVPGVHKASTVLFPNVQALRSRDWRNKDGYTYGLHGTPTTFTLEERIAHLEGARHCVLAPSGLSALALVNLALLKPGDEVLLPDNVYGPSKELARTMLTDLGIRPLVYDPLQVSSAQALMGPATRLLWMEAPGSVTMEFPDMVALATVAKAHGVTVALDNTWGAGLAFKPFALKAPQGAVAAVDVCMHALTKYPSGGGDVLLGSITTVDRKLHEQLLMAHMRLGLGVGANDAEAVLRSLPSIALRYDAQDRSARELAQWLQGQPGVSRVLHPALPGSPGHEHWAQQCDRAAGIFSILLEEAFAPQAVDSFVDALRVFRLGYSWGGPVSLAVPYDLDTMRQNKSHLRGHLVRLCIGLEAVSDLKADLAQALRVLHHHARR